MDIGGGDRALRSIVVLALFLLMLAGCSSSSPPGVYKLGQPYQIKGRWYHPEYDPHYDRVGTASWYGEPFHGRATANGERFDRKSVSAAHPTLPLPSLVRVVNLANHRELVVRVNDRGPFVDDRLIDLSQEAARQLGFDRQGLAPVRVQFVRLADAEGEPPQPTIRSAPAPLPARPAEPAPQLVAAVPPSQLVAPAPPPAPKLAAATPTPLVGAIPPAQCAGRFIQVGAYSEPVRAQRVMAELHGLQAMPVSLMVPAKDHLARVRLGPIADPVAVDATLDRIKRFGFAEAFIVGPEKDSSIHC
jgi:rare lipoprotein A